MPKRRTKSDPIQFRVDVALEPTLQSLAAADDITPSEYCRLLTEHHLAKRTERTSA